MYPRPIHPRQRGDREPGIAPPTLGFERRRMVIVDAHGHAFRAFWGLAPMYALDGLPTNALFGLAGLLRRLVLEERPDFVAVVFDAPDDTRRTFRSAIFPEYKAHRPERPAELARQIPMLREVAQVLGLEPLEHADYEADDIVATLVGWAEAADVHTTVLSADKDLLQLVSARTLVWDAMRGKRYTPAMVEDKLGVPPAMVSDYLALVGDTSDNVPGVPGIGRKSASSLIRTFGSLEAIYANLERVPAREMKKLAAHRERALLSLSLTRLRSDVPLGCGLEALMLPDPAPEAAEELWRRLGFPSFESDEEELRGWRGGARPGPAAPQERRSEERRSEELRPVAAAEEPADAIEVSDLAGLRRALEEARGALALGLAMRGDPPARAALASARAARGRTRAAPAPEPYVPPVLGMALPSGARWRIVVRGGEGARPGRPVQGLLFAPGEQDEGLRLADVAAALGSLLADSRRVLCADDAGRLVPTLNIAAKRFAHDARRGRPERAEPMADPAAAALEALSMWLEERAGRARGGHDRR